MRQIAQKADKIAFIVLFLVMVDFKSSLFPIITSAIGSSLLLFVLNNIVADINQPHIYLQVNSFSGHNNNSQQQTKFQTIAINDGRSAATNIRLTLLYPSANIINYTIPFHNENITSVNLERPTSLVAEMNRLSKGATVIINTTVINKDMVTAKDSSNKYYSVSATFDQGTNTISNLSSGIIKIEDANVIPGIIVALDKDTGKKIWEFNVGAPVGIGGPSIGHGMLFVTTGFPAGILSNKGGDIIAFGLPTTES
jgi:outer membrane protein assembly factor BamB